jgi:tRNA-binding EMAP/Myf-like protein
MGVISHGMVLAARDGDKLALATVDGLARPGSRVA